MKKWWIRIVIITVVLIKADGTFAQRVRYSPYFKDFAGPAFEVAAKVGDYYWVRKEKSVSRAETRQLFEVYDSRMTEIKHFYNTGLPQGTLKQYLIGNDSCFDQLIIANTGKGTALWLKRYSPDGNDIQEKKITDSLPFIDDARSFLLLRSPGGTKNQLLAFQSTPAGTLSLSVLLFDRQWNILHWQTLEHQNIAQPFIQEDPVSFPAEAFDNYPAKLADNGEWTMATPSRTSAGFTLFHGCEDGTFSFHTIRLSPDFMMEDVSVAIDSYTDGASVAVLSVYKNTSLKNLQVSHYSMKEGRFDFDSTYMFNTLVGDLRNKTIVRETLSGLPQGGYLFCKEYGREREENDTATLHLPVQRGDFSAFYFPSGPGDSTWTAQIREPQTTEMNCPALSYLVLPKTNSLMFVYNSSDGFSTFATSSSVDRKGHPIEDPLTFWKFKRQLDFQRGRRITGQEVAVPYANRPGFAIIQL